MGLLDSLNEVKNMMSIDFAVFDNCKNLMESYGEICVQCNKCGRFCEGCVRPKKSFCGICSRNPEIEDQYVSGETMIGEKQKEEEQP